jgi:hypothetical protein
MMKKYNVTDVRRKNSTVEMTEEQIVQKYGDNVKLDGSVNRFGKFFLTFKVDPASLPVVAEAAEEEAPIQEAPKPKKKKAAPKKVKKAEEG